MNKLISIFGMFLIFSCENSEENSFRNKEQSTWVVGKIEYESSSTSTYYTKSTNTTDLAESNTWFADTIGAFKVGDTLIFAKKK